MESVQIKAATIIEAMTIYISAMRDLDKAYAQAKADIEEMFKARLAGVSNESKDSKPLS